MTILVVDDSRTMRMMVLRELRRAGYETRDVLEADDGRSALARIRLGGIDLVLSDLNHPDIDGMTLLQALRHEGNIVPFGFVTAESAPAVHKAALDAGADFVVTKPFSTESLARQVELALEGRRQSDGLGASTVAYQSTIEAVLEELLDRAVDTSPSGPPRPGLPGAVAYYGSGTGRKAMLVVEMGAAAGVAAALSRLPAAEAELFARDGALPEAFRQNLHEVANVLSKVLPGDGERWVLEGLSVFGALSEVPEVVDAPPAAWHRPLEVLVAGYPSGRGGFLFL